MFFSLPKRLIVSLLLASFIIATFAVALYNPARVSAGTCAEDPANLLKNGTMAPGAPNGYGVVSDKWRAFVVGTTIPHFENAENEGWDPNGSQYIWRDFDAWNAGVFQRRKNLVPGQQYHYWMIWGQSLHDIAGNNARSTLINRQIGIDPTGGTDPTSPNIIWSVPYFGGGGFSRAEWNLYFIPTSNIATFFMRAQNGHTDGRNKVFFDTACLFPVNGPLPTATHTATATPTATATLPPGTGVIEDTDAGIVYINSWLQSNDPTASNGTFHSARGAKGSPALLKYNFTGTSITVFYITDPNHGKAQVVIDGVKKGKIDQYSAVRTNNVSQMFSGLAPGPHLIKIKNAGAKNLSALDTVIVLDKLEISGETAAIASNKNVAQRMTATPTRGAPTRTPTRIAPRLIPFKKAVPAAERPSDTDVIWDSRLPGLNAYLVPANVANGTLYWKSIRADYHDPFQHSGDFGSDHNMYFVLTDENGNRVANQKVWQAWPDDATSATTKDNGIADIAMWANYFPSNGPGPYDGYVDGMPSEMVRGMGLPANNHVSFILYFQKTVKGSGGASTATPTATATNTSAPPTVAPSATATPTQVPATVIDDMDGEIFYRGAWSAQADAQAVGDTLHAGAGMKGAPTVLVYHFTGTEITIRFVGAYYHGKAQMILDGVKRGKLDQYRSDTTYNLTRTFNNLPPGEHTLKLKNAGGKNPASSGTTITLDALEFR